MQEQVQTPDEPQSKFTGRGNTPTSKSRATYEKGKMIVMWYSWRGYVGQKVTEGLNATKGGILDKVGL